MGHLQVFFNTEIVNNKSRKYSWWAGGLTNLGNFFLKPVRFFFPGKTIQLVGGAGDVAKVTSYYHTDWNYDINPKKPPDAKKSKQSGGPNATDWTEGRTYGALTFFAATLAFIPGVILGTLCKAPTYFSSRVRTTHHTVKEALTAKDIKIIGADDSSPVEDLPRRLETTLASGQKVRTLTIYAKNKVLDEQCLRLISHINPKEVVLKGSGWSLDGTVSVKNVIRSRRNQEKWMKWDLRALGVNIEAEQETQASQEANQKRKDQFRILGQTEYKPSTREVPDNTPSSGSFFKAKKHIIHVDENEAPEVRKPLQPD